MSTDSSELARISMIGRAFVSFASSVRPTVRAWLMTSLGFLPSRSWKYVSRSSNLLKCGSQRAEWSPLTRAMLFHQYVSQPRRISTRRFRASSTAWRRSLSLLASPIRTLALREVLSQDSFLVLGQLCRLPIAEQRPLTAWNDLSNLLLLLTGCDEAPNISLLKRLNGDVVLPPDGHEAIE